MPSDHYDEWAASQAAKGRRVVPEDVRAPIPEVYLGDARPPSRKCPPDCQCYCHLSSMGFGGLPDEHPGQPCPGKSR